MYSHLSLGLYFLAPDLNMHWDCNWFDLMHNVHSCSYAGHLSLPHWYFLAPHSTCTACRVTMTLFSLLVASNFCLSICIVEWLWIVFILFLQSSDALHMSSHLLTVRSPSRKSLSFSDESEMPHTILSVISDSWRVAKLHVAARIFSAVVYRSKDSPLGWFREKNWNRSTVSLVLGVQNSCSIGLYASWSGLFYQKCVHTVHLVSLCKLYLTRLTFADYFAKFIKPGNVCIMWYLWATCVGDCFDVVLSSLAMEIFPMFTWI